MPGRLSITGSNRSGSDGQLVSDAEIGSETAEQRRVAPQPLGLSRHVVGSGGGLRPGRVVSHTNLWKCWRWKSASWLLALTKADTCFYVWVGEQLTDGRQDTRCSSGGDSRNNQADVTGTPPSSWDDEQTPDQPELQVPLLCLKVPSVVLGGNLNQKVCFRSKQTLFIILTQQTCILFRLVSLFCGRPHHHIERAHQRLLTSFWFSISTRLHWLGIRLCHRAAHLDFSNVVGPSGLTGNESSLVHCFTDVHFRYVSSWEKVFCAWRDEVITWLDTMKTGFRSTCSSWGLSLNDEAL